MPTLPPLIEEDIQRLDCYLNDLLAKSEATAALIIDKGGFLVVKQGDAERFDATTLAALASGAFLANEQIASIIGEPNFNSVYQQGDNQSLLILNVDEQSLLVVIFKAGISVGAVKYYATSTALQITEQMQVAQQRAPGAGLDLSIMNLADPSSLFRKK